MDKTSLAVLGNRDVYLSGALAWATLLFASCWFGHMVFLLGARLDDFCGWARRHMLNTRITLLALRRPLIISWAPLATMATRRTR